MSHHMHSNFGHTISDSPKFQHHPLSLLAPIVHVTAVIKQVESDVEHNGASHQRFLITAIRVLDIQGADPSIVANEAFVAVRYGDNLGLPQRIDGLAAGQPIELQGEYIDQNHAYPSVGNPGDAVIHFTHRPVGFVVYQGQRYQ